MLSPSMSLPRGWRALPASGRLSTRTMSCTIQLALMILLLAPSHFNQMSLIFDWLIEKWKWRANNYPALHFGGRKIYKIPKVINVKILGQFYAENCQKDFKFWSMQVNKTGYLILKKKYDCWLWTDQRKTGYPYILNRTKLCLHTFSVLYNIYVSVYNIMLHVLYKLYYCVKLQSHIYANQYLKLFHTQFAKKCTKMMWQNFNFNLVVKF